MFPEPIEAWAHGPVVRELYHEYQNYGPIPLPTPAGFEPDEIDERTRQLLEEVYEVYGQYSAWGLQNFSHGEAPWTDTPYNRVIPVDTMRHYFASTLTSA